MINFVSIGFVSTRYKNCKKLRISQTNLGGLLGIFFQKPPIKIFNAENKNNFNAVLLENNFNKSTDLLSWIFSKG